MDSRAFDYIRRIDALKAYDKDEHKFQENLQDIPSVDVVEREAFEKLREYRVDEYLKNEVAKRNGGEWKHRQGDLYVCSACGEALMCDDIDCNNFCPNCGAKMK